MGLKQLMAEERNHNTTRKKSRLNKRRLVAFALLLIVGLGFWIWFLKVRLNAEQDRREKMEQDLVQQQQQLDRQNLLIDKLRDDVEEYKKAVPVISSETLKSQLNALQELVTEEYVYTNADKRESSATWIFGWTRPFSDSSLLVTYDGVIKAGIDLSDVQINVDEEKQTVTVTLPKSKITSNNIPQESITVVEVRNGLFNEITFEDYNTFIGEQKIVMEQKAIAQGLLVNADKNARNLIRSFLSVLPGMQGYTLIIE